MSRCGRHRRNRRRFSVFPAKKAARERRESIDAKTPLRIGGDCRYARFFLREAVRSYGQRRPLRGCRAEHEARNRYRRNRSEAASMKRPARRARSCDQDSLLKRRDGSELRCQNKIVAERRDGFFVKLFVDERTACFRRIEEDASGS